MDTVDKKTRSRMMSRVKSKNTSIEVRIRKQLFALGLRYRIHPRRIMGKPDLVLPKYRTIIFVNGCFWHLHGCEYSKIPETRSEWWKNKLEGNKKRDRIVFEKLCHDGWRLVLVWGCAIKKVRPSMKDVKYEEIAASIFEFLMSKNDNLQIDTNGSRVITSSKVLNHE